MYAKHNGWTDARTEGVLKSPDNGLRPQAGDKENNK